LGTMPIGPANPSLRGTEVARQHPAESLADPVAWAKLQASSDWPSNAERWLEDAKTTTATSLVDLPNSSFPPSWLLVATPGPKNGDKP
jgi:hypothetical protein